MQFLVDFSSSTPHTAPGHKVARRGGLPLDAAYAAPSSAGWPLPFFYASVIVGLMASISATGQAFTSIDADFWSRAGRRLSLSALR